MNELNDLLQLLKDTPGHSVTLVKIFRFVTYAVSLKDDILLPQPSAHPPSVAPLILPQAVKQFLATAHYKTQDREIFLVEELGRRVSFSRLTGDKVQLTQVFLV